MADLSKISTSELVDELVLRNEVKWLFVEPGKEYSIEIDGEDVSNGCGDKRLAIIEFYPGLGVKNNEKEEPKVQSL